MARYIVNISGTDQPYKKEDQTTATATPGQVVGADPASVLQLINAVPPKWRPATPAEREAAQ